MDARDGPHLLVRVIVAHLVKQLDAMSVDRASDVAELVLGVGVTADYRLESCFVVGRDHVHDLAKGSFKFFFDEHDANQLVDPRETNSVHADTAVVPQDTRHGESDLATMIMIYRAAFAI